MGLLSSEMHHLSLSVSVLMSLSYPDEELFEEN